MKKLLLLLLLIPNLALAFATTSVPFVATSTDFVFPNRINGINPVLFIPSTATSTFLGNIWIKNNLQISNQSTGCAQFDSTGLLTSSGSACGTLAGSTLTKGHFLVGNDAGLSQATSTIFISSIGNVGIGTVSPTTLLDVNGASTFRANLTVTGNFGPMVNITRTNAAADGRINFTSGTFVSEIGVLGTNPGNSLFLKTNSAFPIIFSTNNTEAVRIISGGNVGIGTTSPYSFLSISNNLNTTANTPLFTIASTTSGTATSTLMTVLASGNVGIGTTTPTSILHLATATTVAGGIAFGTDAALFRSAAGYLTYTSSGTNSLIFRESGIIQSSADGSYIRIGGLSEFASAGAFKLLTNNIERLRIDSSGNVGIGTTTPNWSLQVASSTPYLAITDTDAPTDRKHWLISNIDGIFRIGTSSDALTSTSTRLTIDTAGNVGIGTVVPSRTLEVAVNNNGLNIQLFLRNYNGTASGGNTVGIGFSNESSGSHIKAAIVQERTGSWAVGPIRFLLENTVSGTSVALTDTKMIIMPTGNVGIGTTTPNWTLHVASSTPYLSITDTDAPTDRKHWLISNIDGLFRIGTSSDALSATSTYFTINQAGNVGIGTVSPLQPLHIQGSTAVLTVADVRNSSSGNGAGVSYRLLGFDGSMARFQHNNNNSFSGTTVGLSNVGLTILEGNYTTLIYANGLFPLVFGTNSTERGRFSSGGNFGIGTTTPNWSLQVASSTPYLAITDTNAPVDAKHWLISNNDGIFRIGTSTDALNSTSTYLTILGNTGNVGIATTSPATLLQLFSTTTTTMSIDSNSATRGACIEVKDFSGGGYTYLYTKSGVLYSDTISCK